MAGQKDIKEFTSYASLSDNDFLLASKTDLGGSDASIKVGVLKAQIASDVKPTVVNGYWHVNGVNTGVQAKGKTPVFRKSEQGIEMKYEGEGDSAYFLLIPMADLIVKFNDLTDDQKASIKGETGLSAYELWARLPENEGKSYHEYIGFNRQPATDAATEAQQTMEGISKVATELISETTLAKNAANTAAGSVNSAIENADTIAQELSLLKEPLIEATDKANNAGDYAREQGDFAAEEGGKAATVVPRVDLLEQNKVDGGFSENGELFLTSGGVVVGDPIPVGSGSGGSGGGGGSTLRLKNRGDASLGVPAGQKVVLRYSFSSLDSETQEPTGNGTAVYYVNNARVYTQSIGQGDIDFDITNYLSNGQNQVRVQVTDSYGAIRSLNIRVEVISLVLESSFDDSLTYSNDISFPYTPKGSGEKTIHFILDGVALNSVTTTTTNRQLYYKLPELTHGSHALTVYATMESEGVEISSNILHFSVMYVQAGSNTVIISSSFSQTEVTQYDIVVVPFSVYNPGASTTQIQLKANDEVVSTLVVDRLPQVWSYRVPGYEALKLEIVVGNVKKVFDLVVAKSSIDSEAETEGLELFLTSNGRSNNEEKPGVWKYNNIAATFTGFNFKTNGWALDDDNVTALRISQGAKLEIPFYPFFSDFKQTGKTIELEFRVKNVENFTSTIISCFSGGKGFCLTANDILFKSELSSVSAKFKEEEMIRVSFVVESRLKNRIIYTYINGIASGSIQYVDNDSFEQIPPVGITLGNPDCTLDVYTIRSYSTDLNAYQVLNNYISDTALVSKKLALYDKNQIYDSTGEIVYNLLVNQLPCMTITGELPTFKGDKKTVSMSFENRQNPERSFSADNVQIDVQGTSSQFYPRKNFKHKFKSGLTLTETGEHVTKYALKDNAIPVDTFCEKADFAESSGTHNTGMARYIDSVLRSINYLTPPQKDDERVRTTIDGYPIAIFHKVTDNSPVEFVGKYNFNNDKSTQETFGFKGANECWEFLNNTANRCLFKSADFSGTGWLDDFEGRYPDGGTDATNLSVLVGWVVSCIGNPTKFKDEVSEHFNLNNLLSYYLLSELFGMVDQRAKNMMLASWGNEGLGAYKWYFIFYDNDTCLGINNEGANVFPFNIEDQDTLGDGHVWNGWDSELWKLVKASFTGELAAMYRNMRQTGALSYNGAIRILNDEQAFKWSEVVYNLDGQYKYIQPLIETGQGTYLYALQGSRADHRIWWLKNRFFYMDSKYNAANFLNDFITMRIYTPATWQGIEPNADFDLTLYKDSYVRVKYGSYVLEQRAKAEQTIHIAAPDIQFNDTETIIYGISTVKGIGALSALYPGTVDIANATTLTELIIGSAVEGYKNENLSHVSAGNNKMLRTVDIQNCPNYTEPLDLSGCENIETLKALGSSVSAVKLPVAGIVSRMELPATLANLTIRNQQSLTSDNLILAGISNISTLVLENMNSLDVIGLVKTLLAVEPLKLNRLRLIGVDMEDDDLSVLLKLATIGGLDEQDNPLPRAVITGNFRAGSAYETDIENCRGWFPELEITAETVISDPVVTFEFFSSPGKPLTNTEFTANLPFTKVSDTQFQIKSAKGTNVNYTFAADNHEKLTGSYTIEYTMPVMIPILYLPLRTLRFLGAGDNAPIMGGTVQVIGTEDIYITDSAGKVYIRSGKAFSISFNSEYGEGIASVSASETDTENTFKIYPIVTVFGQIMAWNSMPLSEAVWVIKDTNNPDWEKRVTSDEWGYMETKMSYGSYSYYTEWKGIRYPMNQNRYFNVGTNAYCLLDRTTIPFSTYEDHGKNGIPFIPPETFKPVANGNVQFVICDFNSNSSDIRYRSSTPVRIDWGDGSPIEQVPAWNENETGSGVITHEYPWYDGISNIRERKYWQVEIMDCENLTFLSLGNYICFGAFWTIGNSALKNLSFRNVPKIAWIGDDVFKNDIARTNADYVLAGTKMALPPGLFFRWINVTSMQYAFEKMTFYSRPGYMQRLDLSPCLKLTSLYNTCREMVSDRLPVIKNKKLTDIWNMCYEGSIKEIRSDDILPNEDGTIINTQAAFYKNQGVKIFEFFDGMTTFHSTFISNIAFEKGASMQIFETIPPTISSYYALPTAKTLSDQDVWLYVPDESLELYQGATGWNGISDRMKPASEKPV
jgi:hypothetical protein